MRPLIITSGLATFSNQRMRLENRSLFLCLLVATGVQGASSHGDYYHDQDETGIDFGSWHDASHQSEDYPEYDDDETEPLIGYDPDDDGYCGSRGARKAFGYSHKYSNQEEANRYEHGHGHDYDYNDRPFIFKEDSYDQGSEFTEDPNHFDTLGARSLSMDHDEYPDYEDVRFDVDQMTKDGIDYEEDAEDPLYGYHPVNVPLEDKKRDSSRFEQSRKRDEYEGDWMDTGYDETDARNVSRPKDDYKRSMERVKEALRRERIDTRIVMGAEESILEILDTIPKRDLESKIVSAAQIRSVHLFNLIDICERLIPDEFSTKSLLERLAAYDLKRIKKLSRSLRPLPLTPALARLAILVLNYPGVAHYVSKLSLTDENLRVSVGQLFQTIDLTPEQREFFAIRKLREGEEKAFLMGLFRAHPEDPLEPSPKLVKRIIEERITLNLRDFGAAFPGINIPDQRCSSAEDCISKLRDLLPQVLAEELRTQTDLSPEEIVQLQSRFSSLPTELQQKVMASVKGALGRAAHGMDYFKNWLKFKLFAPQIVTDNPEDWERDTDKAYREIREATKHVFPEVADSVDIISGSFDPGKTTIALVNGINRMMARPKDDKHSSTYSFVAGMADGAPEMASHLSKGLEQPELISATRILGVPLEKEGSTEGLRLAAQAALGKDVKVSFGDPKQTWETLRKVVHRGEDLPEDRNKVALLMALPGLVHPDDLYPDIAAKELLMLMIKKAASPALQTLAFAVDLDVLNRRIREEFSRGQKVDLGRLIIETAMEQLKYSFDAQLLRKLAKVVLNIDVQAEQLPRALPRELMRETNVRQFVLAALLGSVPLTQLVVQSGYDQYIMAILQIPVSARSTLEQLALRTDINAGDKSGILRWTIVSHQSDYLRYLPGAKERVIQWLSEQVNRMTMEQLVKHSDYGLIVADYVFVESQRGSRVQVEHESFVGQERR